MLYSEYIQRPISKVEPYYIGGWTGVIDDYEGDRLVWLAQPPMETDKNT